MGTGINFSKVVECVVLTVPQGVSISKVVECVVLDTVWLVSIAVTPVDKILKAGETQQYTAIGTYRDDTSKDITSSCTFSSSNTDVATITNGGLATGVDEGEVTITATCGSISGDTTLDVIILAAIDIAPADKIMIAGETQQYTATGIYSNNSTDDFTTLCTFSSSDTDVATITSGGLATGVNGGNITITATYESFEKNANLTILEKPTVTISVPTDITLNSFMAHGEIIDAGSSVITRRGFCYLEGDMGDPTIADMAIYADGNFSTGVFTQFITALKINQKYRLRAFAISVAGIGYSDTLDVRTASIPASEYAGIDFGITIDNQSGIGQMSFIAATTIMNNIYLSLMVKRGSFFADPSFGSRLHLLQRAKNTDTTMRLAIDYCKEALQWMIDTGKATAVDVYAQRDRQEYNRLKLLIEVTPYSGAQPVSFTTFIEVI
jgi:phage gp46-like protein